MYIYRRAHSLGAPIETLEKIRKAAGFRPIKLHNYLGILILDIILDWQGLSLAWLNALCVLQLGLRSV